MREVVGEFSIHPHKKNHIGLINYERTILRIFHGLMKNSVGKYDGDHPPKQFGMCPRVALIHRQAFKEFGNLETGSDKSCPIHSSE